MPSRRSRPARRSRLLAAGLSVGAAVGLVVGMVATEHPLAAGGAPPTAGPAGVTDPFSAGGPATPPSQPSAGRIPQTVTSAS